MASQNYLDPEDEPIRIEDEEPVDLSGKQSMGIGGLQGVAGGEGLGLRSLTGGAEGAAEVTFNRPMNNDGSGATRFRMFHSKISLAPLQNMENHINEWIDSDQIEVKHVGHLIGTMEGKRPEPNLLVMVWY
jgi:hypothetical protein